MRHGRPDCATWAGRAWGEGNPEAGAHRRGGKGATLSGSGHVGRTEGGARKTPMLVPTGLKAWARFSRRVALPSGPMEMMKGFAEVSRIDSPAASAKSATRKTE